MNDYEVPDWAGKPFEEILAAVPAGRSLRIETVRIWEPPNRAGLMLFHVDPGAPRRAAKKLCPMLVGDEGETIPDLLEKVATALRLAATGDVPPSPNGEHPDERTCKFCDLPIWPWKAAGLWYAPSLFDGGRPGHCDASPTQWHEHQPVTE